MFYLKKRRRRIRGKKKYVAQQRVYLTKKEGFFFESFAKQTDALNKG